MISAYFFSRGDGMDRLTFCNTVLWQWILPLFLLLTVMIYSIRLRGVPLRGLHQVFRDTYGTVFRRGCNRRQKRIFSSALAATMGTGNLVGTALAVMTGGAGALFWMWISALFGMILVYAENMLGIQYCRKDAKGRRIGGTLGYLYFGTGSRTAAVLFAVCCIFSALGMGNMAQSSTIAQTLAHFGISAQVSGFVTAGILLLILVGGTERIGNVSVWLMPMLCGFYLLGCIVLLIQNAEMIPSAIIRIFREAFGIRAAGCGFCASALLHSMSIGLRRGIFSNEAGLGSSAMLHMEADTDDAALQGKWAAAEVFADTVICCTATALVILTSPHSSYQYAEDASGLLLDVFTEGLGKYAFGFLAVCMVLLAFATMIGWYPCGAACVRYLFGNGAASAYLAGNILLCFAGALGSPDWIWQFCDLCNGLMALPNLWGMCRLSRSISQSDDSI